MKKANAGILVSVVQTKQLSRGAAESLNVRSFSSAAGGNKGPLDVTWRDETTADQPW